MKCFFDSRLKDLAIARLGFGGCPGERHQAALLCLSSLLMLGSGLTYDIQGAMAQPGSVMQIPIPAPQARGAAVGGGGAEVARSAQPVEPLADVVTGDPLAMPGETVPVGNWSGRSGVKEIALAEMPWMGSGGYGVTVVAQSQYQVVVATPSQAYANALKQVMPDAIALADGRMMQAGAFADWRQANALRKALGVYGFLVEVQAM